MGFGLRDFKQLRAESKQKKQAKFVQSIIVGEDFSAAVELIKLSQTHTPENLAIIATSQLSRDFIEKKLAAAFCQIRTEAVANIVDSFMPHLHLKKKESKPIFYKNSEFSEFTGRIAPPTPLLGQESYFSTDSYEFSMEDLLRAVSVTTEQWSELDATLDAYRVDKVISSISQESPSDLVDKCRWAIETKDHFIFSSENLIWSNSAKKFIELMKDKDFLSGETLQFFQNIKETPGYMMSFESTETVYEGENTIFIPRSLTHDWGYFIGEFSKPSEGAQRFSFLGEVHEEEITAEDLAKKIKLLKRNLKRIFKSTTKTSSESIFFDENMFTDNVDDELYESSVKDELPGFFMIGPSAPLAKDFRGEIDSKELKYFPRTLISLCQFSDSFSL